jgi:DNA-binding response OmpR family regulator
VRVAVLADDLIWSTRLVEGLRAAGADPRPARTLDAFRALLADPSVERAVVDLTARAYDGVAALELARDARRPALAVGQHDDHELRKRALAAGAERVFAYRKLFEDGPRTLTAWLAGTAAGSGAR